MFQFYLICFIDFIYDVLSLDFFNYDNKYNGLYCNDHKLQDMVNVKITKCLFCKLTTANPAYSFSALVSEWTPLNGAVGELATASVTWPISGVITKTTA